MKRIISLFIFALALTFSLHAQMEEYPHRLWSSDITGYLCEPENLMQQRNGDIMLLVTLGERDASGDIVTIGNVFYKLSPTSVATVDSLFVADSNPPYNLLARDPQGEGNIRAHIEYDEMLDSTFLRISHFPDSQFIINHDDDIVVPLCDGQAFATPYGYMMDSSGDIIMRYFKAADDGGSDYYLARFGTEGTLKHTDMLPPSLNAVHNIGEFSDNPLQYYEWKGYTNDDLAVFLIDSAFQTQPPFIIDNFLLVDTLPNTYYTIKYHYLDFNYDTEILPIGDNNVLVAARYRIEPFAPDPNYYEHGVAVAKYDLIKTERIGLITFNDFPGSNTTAQCLGFKQTSDGAVYFLYKEEGYTSDMFVIVKMDTDLNVEWKRYIKIPDFVLGRLGFPILYEDEQGVEKGIAWAGMGSSTDYTSKKLVVLFVENTGTVNVVDNSGIEMRPYAFYPNPVEGMLSLDFSPDVKPASLELFDLQGRLVHRQDNSFESVNMSQLPAGIYTLRVTLNDGKSFSDKVVKE